MRVQIPFPKCKSCYNDSPKSFHKSCRLGGNDPLEINPSTNMVYCPTCAEEWDIFTTTYYCSCGSVFFAKDVADEVEYIIMLSAYVAEEIKIAQISKRRRQELSSSSFSDFTLNTLKKIGVSFGYVAGIVENVIKIVKALFTL